MDQQQFGSLLRHLLANIHDYAILEKHPLSDAFPRDPNARRADSGTRAGHLRHTIAAAIESLKPRHVPFDVAATEWRYYLILHGRYVEGVSLLDLQNQLALGDRQVRRLQIRALSLLEAVLYEQAGGHPSPLPLPDGSDELPEDAPAAEAAGFSKGTPDEADLFEVVPESLSLPRVLEEVLDLCASRLDACGAHVTLHFPPDPPSVRADRIILRQILLHLVNTVLLTWGPATRGSGAIVISARQTAGALALTFSWPADPHHSQLQDLAAQAPLRYWLAQLQMRLDLTSAVEPPGISAPAAPHSQALDLTLYLPVATQATVLVVDDHESAIRLIQRFLQPTALRIAGVTDPARVPEIARTLHPQAILLDVMMPTTDGWELLQRLKADPETQLIPVIICSVWNVPELALSLGATDFLKKPIDRDHLLAALAHLLAPGALSHLDQATSPAT